MVAMKAKSGHITLTTSASFKKLAPVYEELYMKFLKEAGQLPEDDEIVQTYIRSNMMDIEKDRKPEGYNRPGEMRLIFPMDTKEVSFYVYSPFKSQKVVKVTESLSKVLRENGFKHSIDWDQMLIDQAKRAQKP